MVTRDKVFNGVKVSTLNYIIIIIKLIFFSYIHSNVYQRIVLFALISVSPSIVIEILCFVCILLFITLIIYNPHDL